MKYVLKDVYNNTVATVYADHCSLDNDVYRFYVNGLVMCECNKTFVARMEIHDLPAERLK